MHSLLHALQKFSILGARVRKRLGNQYWLKHLYVKESKKLFAGGLLRHRSLLSQRSVVLPNQKTVFGCATTAGRNSLSLRLATRR